MEKLSELEIQGDEAKERDKLLLQQVAANHSETQRKNEEILQQLQQHSESLEEVKDLLRSQHGATASSNDGNGKRSPM